MNTTTDQQNDPSGPGAIVRQDNEGTFRVDGADTDQSMEFETLPRAVDEAFGQTRFVRIAPGEYSYTESLYVPRKSHLNFWNVRLLPDDCHGIRIGDGGDHWDQLITGSVEVAPTEGETPAKTCLVVDGAKRLQINGSIYLSEGAQDAAMAVRGGDQGSWWNHYQGLYVFGQFHQSDPGDSVPNAQNFSNCLFRGPFVVDAGNSLSCTNCWWEGYSDRQDVRIRSGSALLHGRFESVRIQVDTTDNVDIVANHESGLIVDERVDDPTISVRRGNFTGYRAVEERNTPVGELFQHDTYDVGGAAVFQLHQSSGTSGRGQLLRAVTSRPEGYYLRGESDTGLDKVIEVNGDFWNGSEGSGLVVTTPDGESEYRIRVNNDGELVTEEV